MIIRYLGEGSQARGAVSISNSDPLLIIIMMRFFREICLVPDKKFRGHIHTFAHANIEQTEKYWSKVTKIPRNQIYKKYTKQSSASLQKRNKLPLGTISIYVCEMRLFLIIMCWVEKIKECLVG